MNDMNAPRRFGAVLRDLLIAKGVTTRMGNPDWTGFSQQLPKIHYETLRKAGVGERYPAPKLIDAVCDALSVEPSTFIEYRLTQVQTRFDPREVGFELAVRNLQSFEKTSIADVPT
jgi:hypothetical protein